MKKIIECVPNFSEGQNQDIITGIADAIKNTAGCNLLDVDPGRSTNRTVYTFTGDPETVIDGALAAARVAKEKIDMRSHKGEHPRFGAMDVCPFIPVAGVSMEECAEVAKHFAERAAQISRKIEIPLKYRASIRGAETLWRMKAANKAKNDCNMSGILLSF